MAAQNRTPGQPGQDDARHSRGPADAKVTLIEYLDYECPHSAEAEAPIRQVMEAFSGEVRLIVRQFPLGDIHENAELAAVAAEAAGNQGRFWEFHDRVFARQNELGVDLVGEIVSELGLDPEKFARDLRDPALAERVEEDQSSGERLGVDSTPTVFVNGKVIQGRVSFVALSRAVARLLVDSGDDIDAA